MKWVEVVIGSCVYLWLGILSPFNKLEKLLFMLSYYVSFDYTVLSRTYSPFLLITIIYVQTRTSRPRNIALCAILLGLLANTDMIGVLLSGTLMIEYIWYLLSSDNNSRMSNRHQLSFSLLLYLCFVVISYLTVKPARDISWNTSGHLFSYAGDPQHFARSVLSNLALVWFPFSIHFPAKFWNPSAALHPELYTLLSVFSVTAMFMTFKGSLSRLTLVALTILGSILFSHFVYLGYMRHFGVVFVAFLCAYWIQRSRKHRASTWALILLFISATGGVFAAVGSWMHPFSNASTAATWMRTQHLENAPIVGAEDFATAGVAEELQRSIYFPQCRCVDSFMLFSHRRDRSGTESLTMENLTTWLKSADQDLGTNYYILILTKQLDLNQIAQLESDDQRVTPLRSFTGAEDQLENFFIYRVQHRS